jgi:hypothetical protein
MVGSENRRIVVQSGLGKKQGPISKITRAKRAGRVPQVIDCLPSKQNNRYHWEVIWKEFLHLVLALKATLTEDKFKALTIAFYLSRDKNDYSYWFQTSFLLVNTCRVTLKEDLLHNLFNWISYDLSLVFRFIMVFLVSGLNTGFFWLTYFSYYNLSPSHD